MKRWVWASLVVIALLAGTVVSSDAGGRHHWGGGPHVFVGFGVAPVWWYGHPYWYGNPYWYYPPPYVYAPPPTVVVQPPPVYVEQHPAPPFSPAPSSQQYWYYCEPAQGYYPNVQTCGEPWVTVPARAQQ
jgi:hypothetical protein